MESLDNTIKGVEHCIDTDVTCDKCVYNKKHTRQCRKDNDVLYHLKQYHSLLKMWNDKLDKEQQNKPLTWEELKQMKGKPIWVEDHNDDDEPYNRWYIVERFIKEQDDEYAVLNDLYYSRKYYNNKTDGWQAYRKEK